MLVMELRGASSKGSINKNGHYQPICMIRRRGRRSGSDE